MKIRNTTHTHSPYINVYMKEVMSLLTLMLDARVDEVELVCRNEGLVVVVVPAYSQSLIECYS